MAFDETPVYVGAVVAGDPGSDNMLNAFLLQFALLASRPAQGNKGVLFFKTDAEGGLQYDDGTNFVDMLGQFHIGTFTRDISTASGNQAVTGVGFTPRYVAFIQAEDGDAMFSVGFDDGINAMCIADEHKDSADNWTPDLTDSLRAIDSGTARAEGNITTLDADGFTIAWVKTGSPTGTINVIYLAMR